MDALKYLGILGIYLIGFVLTGLVSWALVSLIYGRIKRYYLPEVGADPKRDGLVAVVGIVERVLYTSSILVGQPGLIGVWLVLKAVRQWNPSQTTGSLPKDFMLAQIGIALSVIAGAFSGILLSQLLPTLPSLEHWRIRL